jgi:hypothetical protein
MYRTMQCAQNVVEIQIWIVISFIYRCSKKMMCTVQAPHYIASCVFACFPCGPTLRAKLDYWKPHFTKETLIPTGSFVWTRELY